MSAGDVLLFSRKTTLAAFRADPLGTTMTTLIHLTTRSRFNHAALDIGDGLMVEATAKGVSVNPIGSSDDIRGFEPFCAGDLGCTGRYTDNDLEEVLAWSTARVGNRYGYLNAFWCGLRNVFPGAVHIKHGDSLICSELVAEALQRAGHDFGKDSALVSPGDLATHFGVPR
jgi:uncharacterized protein YycO